MILNNLSNQEVLSNQDKKNVRVIIEVHPYEVGLFVCT